MDARPGRFAEHDLARREKSFDAVAIGRDARFQVGRGLREAARDPVGLMTGKGRQGQIERRLGRRRHEVVERIDLAPQRIETEQAPRRFERQNETRGIDAGALADA